MAHPAEQEGLALNPTRVWSYAPSWPTAASARRSAPITIGSTSSTQPFPHARLKSMFATGGCISSATLSHFRQNADLVNWLFFACTQVHILELLPCTPVFDFVKKYHCHFLMSTLLISKAPPSHTPFSSSKIQLLHVLSYGARIMCPVTHSGRVQSLFSGMIHP